MNTPSKMWTTTTRVTSFTLRPPRQVRRWRGKRMVYRLPLALAVGSTVSVRAL